MKQKSLRHPFLAKTKFRKTRKGVRLTIDAADIDDLDALLLSLVIGPPDQ